MHASPAARTSTAQHMLVQAEDTAERLGGGLITREAAECRAAVAAISW